MKRKKGFTVIEMMVAMAVLSMIVIAMARIFQQSVVATDTGYNLTKGVLVGRTILQYVADDLNNCSEWLDEDSEKKFKFEKVLLTTASTNNVWQKVTYELDSGKLTRNGDSLFEPSEDKGQTTIEIEKFSIKPYYHEDVGTPEYCDVFISINIKKYIDADEEDIKNFTTRVYLQNNKRDKYGKYLK